MVNFFSLKRTLIFSFALAMSLSGQSLSFADSEVDGKENLNVEKREITSGLKDDSQGSSKEDLKENLLNDDLDFELDPEDEALLNEELSWESDEFQDKSQDKGQDESHNGNVLGTDPSISDIVEKNSSSLSDDEDQRSLEEVCDFRPIRKPAVDRILEKKRKYLTGHRNWVKVFRAVRDQFGVMFFQHVLNRVMGGVFNLGGKGINYVGQMDFVQSIDNFVALKDRSLNDGKIPRVEENYWHPLSSTWKAFFPADNSHSSRAEEFAAAMGAREATNALQTAWRESKLTNVEGLKRVHEELMRESRDDIELLDPMFREKIITLDERIEQDLGNQQADLALKKMVRREEVYLNLPHPGDIMNVSQNNRGGNEACRKRIDKNVMNLIKSYPEENQELLRSVIGQIRDNAILPNTTPVQAYLYGPPGTGKTTFVHRLGEALHLYVCEINLSSIESHELLGQEQPDDWVSQDDYKVLGKIGDCLRKSTHRNIIIFFDEAGPVVSGGGGSRSGYDYNSMKKQMLQEQFKKILDPSNNKEIMLNSLGIKLATDRVTYIMAGNSPITNPALATRLPSIVFRKLGVTEKETAVTEKFDASIRDLREVFNKEEVDRIEKVGREYFPFIIKEDEKRNPGARVVKEVTQEFLNYVRILVFDELLTGKKLINERKLKKFITDSFNRRNVEHDKGV